jgi:hypothetical protein
VKIFAWTGALAAAGFFLAASCTSETEEPIGSGTTTTGTGGAGGSAVPPPAGFESYCAGVADWQATLAPQTLGKLYGKYVGALQSPQVTTGVMEGQKFIPDHPFQVTRLRVAFVGKPGKARLRLTKTFGRTFPYPWPKTTDTAEDLMPPIELDVPAPDAEKWLEVDLSKTPVYLHPTHHYNLVYEHLGADPKLALEGVASADGREPERDYSRAGVFFPKTKDGGGIGGTATVPSLNYRVELIGNTFCQLPAAARWFTEADAGAAPFSSVPSSYLAVSDYDNDGHDDVIVYDAPNGALGFRGDGTGSFTKDAAAFAAAPGSTMLVFGDVDNDGDRDAFAATWVQVDADSDLYDVMSQNDCNNAPKVAEGDPPRGENVHPGAPEVMGDLKDNDCDGVADDGKDTVDHDKDGFSIAQGDCDDTEPASFPGNPEKLDSLDNDCNKQVDETFFHKLLVNDGKGHFTPKKSGLEVISNATSGAFGDADGDGKLDLYWGNWLKVYPADLAVQDNFFRGAGDGTFTNAFDAAGLKLPTAWAAFGVVWNDYDDDGDQDILVTNYHLSPNQLWQNQGNGTFLDVAPKLGVAIDDVPPPANVPYKGGHTFGADFGDLDGDGDVDFYLCNLAHPRFAPWSDPSQLLFNQGAPGFGFGKSELEPRGMIYDEGDANVQLADYDNDGDLDVAIASLYESHFSRLYRNDAGKFVDITYEAGISARDVVSLTFSDVDEDGGLDLILADRGGAPWVHLFKNQLAAKRGWVELELVGTKANRDAAGARVLLTAGGKKQRRDVRDGGGHGNAQQTHWLHFGLGDAAVDSVEVRWPPLGGKPGATETFTGVAARGRYRIVETGKAQKI